MKQPTPRLDALRAQREAQFEDDQREQAGKPRRAKKMGLNFSAKSAKQDE